MERLAPTAEAITGRPHAMYWISLKPHFPRLHASSASGMIPTWQRARLSASSAALQGTLSQGSPSMQAASVPTRSSRASNSRQKRRSGLRDGIEKVGGERRADPSHGERPRRLGSHRIMREVDHRRDRQQGSRRRSRSPSGRGSRCRRWSARTAAPGLRASVPWWRARPPSHARGSAGTRRRRSRAHRERRRAPRGRSTPAAMAPPPSRPARGRSRAPRAGGDQNADRRAIAGPHRLADAYLATR